MTPEQYAGFIAKFAEAPETQLDGQGAALCAEYDPVQDDPVRFIRNLRDLCVRYAWSSSFVIKALSLAIEDEPPETQEEADQRHADLLAIWEPSRDVQS